ncbi:hypothetical protein [Tomitella gaofuii]|uniref:hypothetical protein n=1 Tax=Tomitella gaofuii TaxID=2760083 RepID=UPI001C713DCD|nr:hypothetical protein [Tomitella gaofuii]
MGQPRWDDPEYSAGGMIRAALWLVQEVGEGNTFTKNQLREAFPGVSQIDRRVRDLRSYGWVLYSSVEDASLLAEDQRLAKIGVHVWDAKARRAAAPQSTITAKERQAVLARDGYMCTLCGIAGGESYPDDAALTAVLSISRRSATRTTGKLKDAFVTECKRCRSGRPDTPLSAEAAVAAAEGLDPSDLRRLVRWMERGRRGTTELDRAWAAFMRVPADMRAAVAASLRTHQVS